MTLSEASVNAAVDAVTEQLAGGFLRVYSADGALLAESRFPDPAFSPASGGSAQADAIAATRIKASGTAANYKAVATSGAEVLSGPIEDLGLGDPSLQEFGEFVVEKFSYQQQP